jgi:hypothetical protein
VEWLEQIEPAGAVRVINPIGNVHARFGGYDAQVEVLAVIQHDAARHGRPEVTIEHVDGGLRVVAKTADNQENDTPAKGADGDARIDLVLFVPVGSPLDVRTDRDQIEVKGLKSDLTASSIEGDITIRSVRGRVNAKTVRGAISVTLETGITGGMQAFSTETGEIEVHLWEDADMTVSIATSGEISTDFSIEIEHRPLEEPGKRARAIVGDGHNELVLNSKRGRVRLLRLQRDFHPDETKTTRPTTRKN